MAFSKAFLLLLGFLFAVLLVLSPKVSGRELAHEAAQTLSERSVEDKNWLHGHWGFGHGHGHWGFGHGHGHWGFGRGHDHWGFGHGHGHWGHGHKGKPGYDSGGGKVEKETDEAGQN